MEMKTRSVMTCGLTTTTATSALSRETPTSKKAPGTPEAHIQKRLKHLLVRIGETLERLRPTSVGQRWLIWVSGARQWVLGLSRTANVACSAIFNPVTLW